MIRVRVDVSPAICITSATNVSNQMSLPNPLFLCFFFDSILIVPLLSKYFTYLGHS